MEYYLEYSGGLGDVFSQMFHGGSYNVLRDLEPNDHAIVALITHNPHTRELFDYHPKVSQIEVRDLGYWLPDQDLVMRQQLGLPFHKPDLPRKESVVEFYPAPKDLAVLMPFNGKRYVVFSVSAGLPERDIPEELVIELVRQAHACSLLPIFVGCNYSRLGRSEFRPKGENVVDMIDKLTVPGVCQLIQDAAGIVCCHSSVNILAWLLRKPQLLLYPQSVYERHIANHDEWAFGIDYPECRHTIFGNLEIMQMAEEFFREIGEDNLIGAQADLCISEGANSNLKVVPLPPESQSISIEDISRLTPAHEVRFLCWLAQQTRGNVVEIGCNKGLTTRDFASTNPDKIIYAVDYFADDASMALEQQCEKPSPQDFCIYAREMPNVVCIHEKSARLNYWALQNVKLAFIDGDHSLESVKADTEAALAFFQSHRGGIIVWHDYYDESPSWVGVKQYVDSLGLDIERVDGTWLALARIKRVSRTH